MSDYAGYKPFVDAIGFTAVRPTVVLAVVAVVSGFAVVAVVITANGKVISATNKPSPTYSDQLSEKLCLEFSM